jgi:2-amino-4-hydroxy-6-hydroxymethyldihydropteridine diphosphokinase
MSPISGGGKVSSESTEVYLGLGTNLGDRQANLDKALSLLSQRLGKLRVSSVYDTEPVGNINQPRFLNLVCQGYTNLAPVELLALAKGIELKLGRALHRSSDPRPIDVDILFYGDQVVETPELTIPHPRLTQRAFVLFPLAELAPKFVHPVTGQTVKEMKDNLKEKQGVFKWNNNQEA